MARNLVTVEQIVSNFKILVEGDDYCANTSDSVIRTLAIRGIREMGFDMLKRVRSLKLPVNTALNTVDLPDDFVDLTKIGYVASDGLIYVFGENKNINYSRAYVLDSGDNPIDSDGDGVYDRVDDKTVPNNTNSLSAFDTYIFRNYTYAASNGRLYGLGGGQYSGEYRINYEQNRIEVASTDGITDIVIEYIADEALSSNPTVHKYAEDALRAYIYYKIVERKANVPANEKMRARQEYYNERRLANSRLKSFTKEEALKTIRKNFRQSPKY